MVSMVETSHPDQNDTVMEPVVPKSEPLPDGSISSTESTPDAEAEPLTQDTAQTQKRKGGRKPVRNISAQLDARIRGPAFFLISVHHVLLPPWSWALASSFHLLYSIDPLILLDLCHLGRTKAAQ